MNLVVSLFRKNKHTLLALIMDGVSKIVKSTLKSKSEFTKSEIAGDVAWLMNSLDDIMFNFEKNKSLFELLYHLVPLPTGSYLLIFHTH